jgi:excisionase family DNA binding protein
MAEIELLTTKQAGDVLGVSRARIHQFIAEGRLPAIKPGREYLVMRADLQAVVRKPVGHPRKEPAAGEAQG